MKTTKDKILAYIKEFKAANNGISPPIRDIMLKVGIHSTSVAHYHITNLIEEGEIFAIDHNGKRLGIGIPDSEWRMNNG